MNDARVLALAACYQAYPGNPIPTLRGSDIVDFAHAVIAEYASERIDDLMAVRAALEGQTLPPAESGADAGAGS